MRGASGLLVTCSCFEDLSGNRAERAATSGCFARDCEGAACHRAGVLESSWRSAT